MDNSGNNNSDKPIPLDNGPGAPAPVKANAGGSAAPVSRAPLNLGGTGAPVAGPVPASPAAAPKPAPTVQAPQVLIKKPVATGPAPVGRISNCRTFFTKLHPGAIKFLDDQITAWLKENPSIVIKHTDVVTGEILEKKTEPSILITVWY